MARQFNNLDHLLDEAGGSFRDVYYFLEVYMKEEDIPPCMTNIFPDDIGFYIHGTSYPSVKKVSFLILSDYRLQTEKGEFLQKSLEETLGRHLNLNVRTLTKRVPSNTRVDRVGNPIAIGDVVVIPQSATKLQFGVIKEFHPKTMSIKYCSSGNLLRKLAYDSVVKVDIDPPEHLLD